MESKLSGRDEIEYHDVEEVFPPSSGDDCLKRNEEMIFQDNGFSIHNSDCMKKIQR
jgi:hypothetical protein